ncbi:hypothetical protein [Rhizobium leguminosarum]|nr:hypothetical protein [Rhizobium leguminosarum]
MAETDRFVWQKLRIEMPLPETDGTMFVSCRFAVAVQIVEAIR